MITQIKMRGYQLTLDAIDTPKIIYSKGSFEQRLVRLLFISLNLCNTELRA
jgi:hypothetical protein